jgi:predicted peroxiredoxin
MDIVWRRVLISKQNSDILEIRLYDHLFQLYFKKQAKIQDSKQVKELMKNLQDKGVKLSTLILEDDWF